MIVCFKLEMTLTTLEKKGALAETSTRRILKTFKLISVTIFTIFYKFSKISIRTYSNLLKTGDDFPAFTKLDLNYLVNCHIFQTYAIPCLIFKLNSLLNKN